MLHLSKYILNCILAGCLAIIYDITLRQTIFESVVEKGYITEECKSYRRTLPHHITIFFMGITMYIVMSAIGFKNGTI